MWQTGLTKHAGFQHLGSNQLKKKKLYQVNYLKMEGGYQQIPGQTDVWETKATEERCWRTVAAWLRLLHLLHLLLFTGCCICTGVLYLGQLVSSEGFLQTPPHILHQVFLFPERRRSNIFTILMWLLKMLTSQRWLSVLTLIRQLGPLKRHNHPKRTKAKNILPNVVIGHYEGLAERLCCIEPHARVLLHCCCELAGDGGGAGVQGAGDGREQRFVWIRRSDSWPEQTKRTENKFI